MRRRSPHTQRLAPHWSVKLEVADSSRALPHPGKAVSEVLIDLRPTLAVENGTLTIAVTVSDPDAARARSHVVDLLQEAGVSTAARVIDVAEV